MALLKSLPADLTRKFEVFDWRNALAILQTVHASELKDVTEVLSGFEMR